MLLIVTMALYIYAALEVAVILPWLWARMMIVTGLDAIEETCGGNFVKVAKNKKLKSSESSHDLKVVAWLNKWTLNGGRGVLGIGA